MFIFKKKDYSEKVDGEDEKKLLKILKNKTKLLKKLGGEIPSDVKKLINEEPNSANASLGINSRISENSSAPNSNLLQEIQKTQLKRNRKYGTHDTNTGKDVGKNSKTTGKSAPNDDKPLLPSSKALTERERTEHLLLSTINKDKNVRKYKDFSDNNLKDKKNGKEDNEIINRNKLDSPILRKKLDALSNKRKYSHDVGGISNERAGLRFSENNENKDEPVNFDKNTRDRKKTSDDDNKDESELKEIVYVLETKLKLLGERQMYMPSPVQEMTIQMQVYYVVFIFFYFVFR